MKTPAHGTKAAERVRGRRDRHIFISYSTRDRLAVDKLADDLRMRHYPLWMDVSENGLNPDEAWRETLIRQAQSAAVIIACVSADFLDSPYCKLEIETALAQGIPVLPVIVRRLEGERSLAELKIGHLQYWSTPSLME